MKILFIAGCVEPGRSGVGDYTRLLAVECVKLRHTCAIASVNDPFVSQITKETLRVGEEFIEVLRSQGGSSHASGISTLREMIQSFDPDWISLQFVPYAFENRGFVWPRLKGLAAVIRDHCLHVMFHELWIGQHPGASWKEALCGTLQRSMVKWLLKSANPSIIHTSTPLYQILLQDAGIQAKFLPMFGTVCVQPENGYEWPFSYLEKSEIALSGKSRSSFWIAGFFGSIHAGFAFDEFLSQLEQAAQEKGQALILLSIGDPGPGVAIWNKMEQTHRDRIHFVTLGQQSEECVSHLLNSMDMGLSSTPLDIIGKSSSVAAMLEHGLPVVVLDDGCMGSTHLQKLPAGVFSRKQFFAQKAYMNPFPRIQREGVNATAKLFLASLSETAKCSEEVSEHPINLAVL